MCGLSTGLGMGKCTIPIPGRSRHCGSVPQMPESSPFLVHAEFARLAQHDPLVVCLFVVFVFRSSASWKAHGREFPSWILSRQIHTTFAAGEPPIGAHQGVVLSPHPRGEALLLQQGDKTVRLGATNGFRADHAPPSQLQHWLGR